MPSTHKPMSDFTGGPPPSSGNTGTGGGIGAGMPSGPSSPIAQPSAAATPSQNAEEFLVNYNEQFKDAEPTPFRDDVIQQTLSILIGKNKPNPLLIGPAGVGKTKIVEDIARRLANNDPGLPDNLQDYVIYELPLSNIVAGSSLVGEMEAKIQAVLDFLTEPKKKRILFIDEIHQLVESTNKQTYGQIAQIMKPTLSRGLIKCIGATTSQDASMLMDDPALNRRFSRVIVDELTKQQTTQILNSLTSSFIAHYNNKIAINTDLLPVITELADTYHVPGYHRPDTAITLLDRACGEALINRKIQEQLVANDPVLLQALKANPVVTLTEKVVKTTAIRLTTGNSKPESLDVDKLKQALSRIKGQDEAVKTIVRHLREFDMGLFEKTKPMTMLFIGPSGVGKTEVTKIISQELNGTQPLVLNMTEYNSPASINRIIGSPAGYVGYDSHQELPFDALESNPYQIILLDEFEKCHPAIQTLFMQAFDEGYIKTNKGQTIDFSKSIIIATTNACKQTVKRGLGFTSETSTEVNVSDLSKFFDIALLNRFYDRLTFNPISKETYAEILQETYIRQRERVLQNNRFTLEPVIPDDKLQELVDTSYNEEFGARPAERTAQTYIMDQVL